MITKETYAQFVEILREELIPAMGCTEPIAIAYATAKARATLGEQPISGKIAVSGNIVKNAKSVTVPHTGGLCGIHSAFAAGLVARNADKELQVLSAVSEKQIEEIKKVSETFPLETSTPDDSRTFDIRITLKSEHHTSFVRIADTHTNVVKIRLDDQTLFEKPLVEQPQKTDRTGLSVE